MSPPPPAEPELLRAARAAYAQGRTQEALQHCATLLRQAPALADAHFLFGMALADAGRIGDALQAVSRAAQLHPTAEHLAQQGRLLIALKRGAQALAVADRAVRLRPTHPLTLDTVGCIFSHMGAHERALPLFEDAVTRDPQPGFRYNLASTLGFLGRFDEAAEQYEQLIAQRPDFVKAHTALSALRRQTPDRNHVARLEALLASRVGTRDELPLRHALAKEQDDLGDVGRSAQHLLLGNAAHRARLGYRFEQDRVLFERLMQRFAEPDYFSGPGTPTQAPIFVIGMPRTGTTLVDRILASHPQVQSAGELQVMPVALKRLSATPARQTLDLATIDAAGRVPPALLGARYLADSRAYLHEGATRFTDKLPLNFLYAGYIARALPEARIVCLLRDPRDTVWSNFRHLFATGFSYYNYAFDLADTADYVIAFRRLLDFWDQLFPNRILRLSYEELVHDQRNQTRRLLDHCALGWDERCLHFHDTGGAVATPSNTQVRQPLYAGAVGRWKRYEPWLGPAIERLRGAGLV